MCSKKYCKKQGAVWEERISRIPNGQMFEHNKCVLGGIYCINQEPESIVCVPLGPKYGCGPSLVKYERYFFPKSACYHVLINASGINLGLFTMLSNRVPLI
jgi:hypothetical protein